MDVMGFIFGRRPVPVHAAATSLPLIEAPPAGVVWRQIRPRPSASPVNAMLAQHDGVLSTKRGPMPYRAGSHYIVTYAPHDQSVIRRDIFERTYVVRPDGDYDKNLGIEYRYFVLSYPATILTLEGPEDANPGDWIVEGVAGELHPVSPEKAKAIYAAA